MNDKDRIEIFKKTLWSLIVLDLIVWGLILFSAEAKNLEMYFLDVGQGDSTLIRFSGGAKLLIDAGPPNGRLQKNLETVLPIQDRYIDLVLITHPQLDHFGGFIDLFKRYKIGAVLMSKHRGDKVSWKELEKVMRAEDLKIIEIAAGDQIHYGDSELAVLSPRNSDSAKDDNDLCVATLLKSEGIKAFFGCDISAKKERELAKVYNLDVDVLKVSHHGSKFSSDPAFLKETSPLVSVFEVGKNSYGHPAKDTLARVANFSSQFYRTDQDGLVKVVVDSGKLEVYSRK